MNEDLLFILIPYEEWKMYAESGTIKPEYYSDTGYIRCYNADTVQQAANDQFAEFKKIYLLVIDPNKIGAPVKTITTDGYPFLAVHGKLSIDTVIDRIAVQNDPENGYSISVSHYE